MFSDKRLLRLQPAGCERLLVCFPHAGAGVSMFHDWRARLAPWAQLVLVQLPGREDRLGEPIDEPLPALSARIADELASTGRRDIVLLGHSMGATVAWWVASRLWSRHRTKSRVVVSAQSPRPPVLAQDGQPAGVACWFRRLGEPVPAALASDELRTIFEATFSGDLAWMRREFAAPIPGPLPLELNALHAQDDHLIDQDQMAQWREHTTGPFRLSSLPGGHLHLMSNPQPMLKFVRALLADRDIHVPAPSP
jgi:pyochelin biosynthetic protein PchC